MNPTCDWAVERRCIPGLVSRRCQYSGGCNKYVHHPCTIDWAIDNNIEEGGIAILCREHHPEYQRYTKQNSLNDTKWSGHSHSSSKAHYPGNNDHYKDRSHDTVNSTGGDSIKSVETHGKYDHVSSKEFYYKGRKQDVSKVKLDRKNDSDERSRFDNDKKIKIKVIRQNHTDDNSTDDKDPNMDIFKSDSFAESLTKNLKEGQPKRNSGCVNVYILSPF